jgi:hypothetical protein
VTSSCFSLSNRMSIRSGSGLVRISLHSVHIV